MIDWDDLPYFLAVARQGSLNGASKLLGVNHSTVFRRINAIEHKLGARLFERLAEGYLLTELGHSVLGHAEAAENSIHALERVVAGKDFDLSGEINITAPLTIAECIVAPCIVKFHQKYPRICINIIVSSALYDLSKRDADIAIRSTNKPPDYLVGRKITDLIWSAYAGKAYLKKYDAPASVHELEAYNLVGADESLMRIEAYKWLKQNYSKENFSCSANDVKTITTLCAEGMGIAILPSNYFNKSLVKLFDIEPEFRDELWMLSHPDLRHVSRIKVFSKYLYEYMRKIDF